MSSSGWPSCRARAPSKRRSQATTISQVHSCCAMAMHKSGPIPAGSPEVIRMRGMRFTGVEAQHAAPEFQVYSTSELTRCVGAACCAPTVCIPQTRLRADGATRFRFLLRPWIRVTQRTRDCGACRRWRHGRGVPVIARYASQTCS